MIKFIKSLIKKEKPAKEQVEEIQKIDEVKPQKHRFGELIIPEDSHIKGFNKFNTTDYPY